MPENPGTAGADGKPHRDLALTRSAARENQVHRIRAGDQQDQRHHAGQRVQRCFDLAAYLGISLRQRIEDEPLVEKELPVDSTAHLAGVTLQPSLEYGLEGGKISGRSHHHIEPADAFLIRPRLVLIRVAGTEILLVMRRRLHQQRYPCVNRRFEPEAVEAGRRHANDGEGGAVQVDGTAKDGG